MRQLILLCEQSQAVVYHGTGQHFEQLDPARGHLGVHFTSNKAAAIRFAGKDNGRVFVAHIDVHKPIHMPDMKLWYPHDIIDELKMMRHEGSVQFPDTMLSDLKRLTGPIRDTWREMRTILLRYGFDGIQYENTYERAAATCWIVFTPEQIHVVDVLHVPGGGNPIVW